MNNFTHLNEFPNSWHTGSLQEHFHPHQAGSQTPPMLGEALGRKFLWSQTARWLPWSDSIPPEHCSKSISGRWVQWLEDVSHMGGGREGIELYSLLLMRPQWCPSFHGSNAHLIRGWLFGQANSVCPQTVWTQLSKIHVPTSTSHLVNVVTVNHPFSINMIFYCVGALAVIVLFSFFPLKMRVGGRTTPAAFAHTRRVTCPSCMRGRCTPTWSPFSQQLWRA